MKSLLFVPFLFLFLASCGEPTPAQRAQSVIEVTPKVTPATAATTDGIAIMIVVDCSGSMAEGVPNSAGKSEAKIEIAKRSVATIIKQTEAFAKQHAERNVKIGVATFNGSGSFNVIVAPNAPNSAAAQAAIDRMSSGGGTAIGDAIIAAKQQLDTLGLTKVHIVTITDGENGSGADPADVAAALAKLPQPASLYVIGFDVNASVFDAVKKAGSLVLAAQNESELQKTLDFVLGSKILLEKEE